MVRVVVWLIGYVHKCTSFWTCLITFKQCSTINFPKIYVLWERFVLNEVKKTIKWLRMFKSQKCQHFFIKQFNNFWFKQFNNLFNNFFWLKSRLTVAIFLFLRKSLFQEKFIYPNHTILWFYHLKIIVWCYDKLSSG